MNNDTNTIDLVSKNSSIPFIFTFSYNPPLVSILFLSFLSCLQFLNLGIIKPLAKTWTLPITVLPLALTLIVFQAKILWGKDYVAEEALHSEQ